MMKIHDNNNNDIIDTILCVFMTMISIIISNLLIVAITIRLRRPTCVRRQRHPAGSQLHPHQNRAVPPPAQS